MAVIINFFIQVGAFSETELSGMFDTEMIGFLCQSAVGDSVLWRLLAFIVLGFALGQAILLKLIFVVGFY